MPVPQNAEAIYKFLVSHGLNANAAAGILGNIEQESGGNPGAGVWPNNWGLIQWTPASHYFSTATTNLTTQLNAILAYIKANGSIAAINAHASSPSAAALYFSNTYERPAAWAANNANREASANAVAAAAKAGKWTGGTPTSGSSSGGSTAKTPSSAHTSTSTVPASTAYIGNPSSGTTTPASASTPATTTSFPGGSADPLNWPSDVGNAISNALNPANWLSDIFGSATANEMLKRGGLIILGGLLILVGVWILAGKQVTQIAVEAGKAYG